MTQGTRHDSRQTAVRGGISFVRWALDSIGLGLMIVGIWQCEEKLTWNFGAQSELPSWFAVACIGVALITLTELSVIRKLAARSAKKAQIAPEKPPARRSLLVPTAVVAIGLVLLVIIVFLYGPYLGKRSPIRNYVLEMAIRKQIGMQRGVLDEEILSTISKLDLYGYWMVDCSGVEYCTNLTELDLGYTKVRDINDVVESVCKLKNLQVLSLNSNGISDITPLAELAELQHLRALDLSLNEISDLSPLVGLTQLKELRLEGQGRSLVDIGPLKELENLDYLSLGVKARASQGGEEWPIIITCSVADLSALVENAGLGEGDEVYLYGNPLSEKAVEEQIPALLDRKVTVHVEWDIRTGGILGRGLSGD